MNLIPKSRLLLMFPFLLSTVQNTTGVIQVEVADHGKPPMLAAL